MIPKQYDYLLNINDLPRMVKIAMDNYGIKEITGSGSNTTILSWAHELGITNTYSNDEVPWCGLFVAMVVKRSGREPVANPLWARNWQTWENRVNSAMLGDVLVFVRKGGGHVGIYVGEDRYHYHVLGGNQANSVNIMMIDKDRCVSIRRPVYKNQPSSVKRYFVEAKGEVSTNES